MHDATQLAVKAAIIESRAIEARIMAAHPTMTSHGQAANYHTSDALTWAMSILTGEPVNSIRARVNQAARDKMQLSDYSPRRIA